MMRVSLIGQEELAEARLTPVSRLGKYMRREIRAEFKRIAFQVRLLSLFDSRLEREMARFHALEPLKRYWLEAYGLTDEQWAAPDSGFSAAQLRSAARTVPGNAARRSLKLMQRQLMTDICRFVEKAQLLRTLDTTFAAQAEQLGWTRSLDTIARWHAMGGAPEP